MRKASLSFMALVLAIAFIGCPYTSDVPFDSPSMRIDNRLLGKWYTSNNPQKNASYHIVSKKSAREYKIVEYTWNSSQKKFTEKVYGGWLSKLRRNTFLTVKTNNNKYVFNKLASVSGTTVRIDQVTDNVREKFNSPAKLKAFIMKNMHLSFFYEKSKNYYKK